MLFKHESEDRFLLLEAKTDVNWVAGAFGQLLRYSSSFLRTWYTELSDDDLTLTVAARVL